MNFQIEVSQIFASTATFDIRFVLFLFSICAIGEFGLPIPYVLETVWLLAGFRLGLHELSVFAAFGLWAVSQIGRQTGGLALYQFSRISSATVARLSQNNRIFQLVSGVGSKVVSHLNVASAASIALGRLMGLRIPITLLAAAKGARKQLHFGILLSSSIFDGIFIGLGLMTGFTTHLSHREMLFLSLAGLTVFYIFSWVIRSFLSNGSTQKTF